jgi:hypothetical protein
MKVFIILFVAISFSISSFADDFMPDAYEVLLKNKDEIIEHDGCNYPDSGIESGKVKLGHAFRGIFDSLMLQSQDMIVFNTCLNQGEYGWLCSISFNEYVRGTKEEGPSPYSMVFSVDNSLSLVHELKLMCH